MTQEYINTVDELEISIMVACAEHNYEEALSLENELRELRR